MKQFGGSKPSYYPAKKGGAKAMRDKAALRKSGMDDVDEEEDEEEEEE